MTNLTEIIPASEWAGRVKRSKSDTLHEDFAFACRVRRLPEPRWKGTKELMFAKEAMDRRWKFDFAWPEYMVAVEIEGLVCRKLFDGNGTPHNVVMGRHATITGIKEDMVKYNAAALLGWTVLRFEQTQLKSVEAIDTTVRVLAARGWRPGQQTARQNIPESIPAPSAPPPTRPPRKPRKKPAKAVAQLADQLNKHERKLKKPAPTPTAASSLTAAPSPEGAEPATAAPVLSPAVQEIAETYPRGAFDADLAWQRATIAIHALMKNGVSVTKLAAGATQYRRQQAAMRTIGTAQVLPPDEFFLNDFWQGPFPMPVDPAVADAERETAMTNEQWLASGYAKR